MGWGSKRAWCIHGGDELKMAEGDGDPAEAGTLSVQLCSRREWATRLPQIDVRARAENCIKEMNRVERWHLMSLLTPRVCASVKMQNPRVELSLRARWHLMLRASVDSFFEICTGPTLPVRTACRTLEYFVSLHSNSFSRSIFLGRSEGRKTVWHYVFTSTSPVRVNYHFVKWHFFFFF